MRWKTTRGVAVLIALSVAAAACGGDDGGTSAGQDNQDGEVATTENDADAGESDAGESDAGESDAGESDAGESDAGESDAGESDAGPASESDRTLIIAETAVPGGFDGDAIRPGTQAAVVNLNEPLIGYGTQPITGSDGFAVDGAQLEPRLAESWSSDESGTVWTFNLRTDVVSAAGNPLTADDVKWSWDKSLDQGRTGNFIARAGSVSSVEVIDEHTVQFTLSAPNAIFIRTLAGYVPGIYDSTEMMNHATDDDPWAIEWLADNHAGFGPYMIESVTAGQQAVFVANPNYYLDEPFFTRVIFREVPEASNRNQLISQGQVDVVAGLTSRQISDLRSNDNVVVHSPDGNLLVRLLMNANFEPFDDLRVRQAINYAMGRDQIIDVAFNGQATISRGPVSSSFPCFSDEAWVYDTDIDKAQELLAEAGFEDGLTFELLYSNRDGYYQDVAVQVQQTLAEAGIEVLLRQFSESEQLARQAPDVRDIPIFVDHTQPNILDAGYSLVLTSTPAAASNKNDFFNERFIELVEQANTTLDEDARCDILAEAQRVHLEDAPWAYIAQPQASEVMNADVSGYIWHPDNQERWYNLRRG